MPSVEYRGHPWPGYADCGEASCGSENKAALAAEEALLLRSDPPEQGDAVPLPFPSRGIFRNERSKTLHVAHDFSEERAKCGILLNPSFSYLSDWPAISWPKCKRCFEGIESIQQG